MPEDESADGSRIDELESRIDRLERTVADLREVVETIADSSVASPDSPSPPSEAPSSASSAESLPSTDDAQQPDASDRPSAAEAASSPAAETASSSSLGSRLHRYATTLGLRSEDWISYVGIGLLLLGLAFLFKYSIERGWLTPTVRIGFGVSIGLLLLGAGLRRADDRPVLQQILLGGSSATFYGTVFAAYQLYGLLSSLSAFGSMILITVATVLLGLRAGYASIAVIGITGGFGAPFLLYTQADGGAGLTLYTCLVVSGACVVYLYRGWRSLLYLALVGGWAVLLMPCVEAAFTQTAPSDGVSIQGSLILAWLLLGGAPVCRPILQRWDPDRFGSSDSPSTTWGSFLSGRFPTAPVTAAPLLCLLATRLLWPDVPAPGWAVVAAGGALLYGGLYWALRRHDLHAYAPVHGVVATVLATYGASHVLGGSSVLLVWAVEAALLPRLARRLNDPLLRLSGHVLAGLVLGRLGMRFLWHSPAGSLVAPAALSELLALGLLTALFWGTRTRWLNRLYQALLIGGWFGWWIHKLSALSHGPSYLIIVGSLSAVGLLVLGRRFSRPVPRLAAHITLLVLAGALGLRLPSPSTASMPLLHLPAASELVGIGALVGGGRLSRTAWQYRSYQGLAVAGWLGWTLHEFAVLPHGQAYVSILWGGTAVSLLLGGAWCQRPFVQKSGLAVLMLFVGKLFFVDLNTLSTLSRIMLFLGMGIGFLVISYLLPGMGPRSTTETASAQRSSSSQDG